MTRRPRVLALFAAVSAIALSLAGLSPAASAPSDDPPVPPEKIMDETPELIQGVNPDKQEEQAPEPVTAPADPLFPTDSFSGAQLATGASWTVTGSTVDATTEKYEPLTIATAYGYTIKNTVWVKWTAPASGWVTLDMESGAVENDFTLAIFTGSTMKKASRKVVGDDNVQAMTLLPSITGFEVTRGVSYHFQVGMNSVSIPGQFGLTLVGKYVAPANDNKADAIAESGSSWTVSGTTVGASIEPGYEPITMSGDPSGPYKRFNSVWWKWTPTAGAVLNADTAGSEDDTYLAIFSYRSYEGLREVAFSDDPSGTQKAAITGFQARAGYTYYFQVGHVAYVSRPQFPVKLKVTSVPNGPVVTKVTPTSGPAAGGTIIQITGTRLTGATKVLFNGTASDQALNVIDDKHLTVVVPEYVEGKVYVQVHHPTFGDSLPTTKAMFTYK